MGFSYAIPLRGEMRQAQSQTVVMRRGFVLSGLPAANERNSLAASRLGPVNEFVNCWHDRCIRAGEDTIIFNSRAGSQTMGV
jgi:hypothetical protein